MNKWIGRRTDGWTNPLTYIQRDRKTDRQSNRQTDRHTDR